ELHTFPRLTINRLLIRDAASFVPRSERLRSKIPSPLWGTDVKAMTYGRGPRPRKIPSPGGATVSHLAELVGSFGVRPSARDVSSLKFGAEGSDPIAPGPLIRPLPRGERSLRRSQERPAGAFERAHWTRSENQPRSCFRVEGPDRALDAGVGDLAVVAGERRVGVDVDHPLGDGPE